MHEPGHLFVARGDLRQLACDGVLVPTDAARSVTESWRDLVAAVPSETPEWPDEPLRIVGGDGDQPVAWLVATASLAGSGGTREDVSDALRVLLRRVEAFVRVAIDELSTGASERPRPLLAMPVVGTGEGGLRARPGAVVSELLTLLDRIVAEHEVDVVVVARTAELEALCRHWRRKLWADRHGEAEGYADVVAARWCRGRVVAGSVRVEGADEQLHALLDRAAHDQLVPFFGSGVSRASGAPSWTTLLDQLSPAGAVELFEGLVGQDHSHMADPFARAQVIANLDPEGGERLRRRLGERLAFEQLSLLHVLLANLGARDAITTNYDIGYERACDAAGIDVSIVPSPGGEHRLVKLHGSLGTAGGEPLLTRNQLLDFQAERGPLAGVLQMLLLTGHLLFVGYSMSDPSLHAAIHAVGRALESEVGPGRATMATSLQVDPSPALAALWERTVDVLWPSGEHYPTGAERARQKEILLDLLADAASHGSIPLLAMDDEAAELDLTDDERELRRALLDLDDAYRRTRQRSALWDPVEQLLHRFHRAEREDDR